MQSTPLETYFPAIKFLITRTIGVGAKDTLDLFLLAF